MKAIKCPNCNANLSNYDTPNQTYTCDYCGGVIKYKPEDIKENKKTSQPSPSFDTINKHLDQNFSGICPRCQSRGRPVLNPFFFLFSLLFFFPIGTIFYIIFSRKRKCLSCNNIFYK